MDRDELIKEIIVILRATYQFKLPPEALDGFAEELYEAMFIDRGDLEKLIDVILSHEEAGGVEYSEWDNVFSPLLNLLEFDEVNAERLYKIFMRDYDSFENFLRLVNQYDEFLSAEQLEAVKQKGCDLFGRDMLEALGIDI